MDLGDMEQLDVVILSDFLLKVVVARTMSWSEMVVLFTYVLDTNLSSFVKTKSSILLQRLLHSNKLTDLSNFLSLKLPTNISCDSPWDVTLHSANGLIYLLCIV